MKKRLKYTVAVSLFLFVVSGMLFGEESKKGTENEDFKPSVYGLGDQMFEITGGLVIPLFFQALDGTVSSTNLSLGGTGSLSWSAFVAKQLSLGIDFGGMFSLSPSKRVLVQIPITAKLGYMFRLYPIDIPLYLGTGVIFTKIGDDLFVGSVFKPGTSLLWNINSEWAIGLNLVYWWVPQIYSGADLKDQSRFGNFLEVSFSGVYHF